jgi:hypothetical protein
MHTLAISTDGNLQDSIGLVIKTGHFAVYPYKRSIVKGQISICCVGRHIFKPVKGKGVSGTRSVEVGDMPVEKCAGVM